MFYAVTIIWCLLSSLSGDYRIRFAILVIYLFMAAIFIWSVLRIQNVIKRNNTEHKYLPKRWLINLNLIIYTVFSIFWSICYGLVFYWEQAKNHPAFYQFYYLSFSISYILIVLTELVRACIFCFMSTRFSIEPEEANRHFFMLFNKMPDEVADELAEKQKCKRLHDFQITFFDA